MVFDVVEKFGEDILIANWIPRDEVSNFVSDTSVPELRVMREDQKPNALSIQPRSPVRNHVSGLAECLSTATSEAGMDRKSLAASAICSNRGNSSYFGICRIRSRQCKSAAESVKNHMEAT